MQLWRCALICASSPAWQPRYRLRKLDEGGYDAIVLAAAGLKRLGLGARIRAWFEVDQMIPCAGQGALGLELRADAPQLAEAVAQLSTV